MGEAASLLKVAVPAILAAAALTIFLPTVVSWTARYRGSAVALAVFVASLGIPFWISAAVELLRAWKRRTLATTGAYALCRHPIFAVWIWFVLPFLALAFDSWAFLAAAVVLGLGMRPGAAREEGDLEREFGEDWRRYRGRTWMLVPRPRLSGAPGTRFLKAIGILAGLAVLALAGYVLVSRPLIASLGTTRVERRAALPGDELLPSWKLGYTQAVTIQAPVEEVWPWLAQVGYRRAGWYNIDVINRSLAPDFFLDGKRSSAVIHPELQDLREGDELAIHPLLSFPIVRLEPGRTMVLAKGTDAAVPRGPDFMAVVWTFSLVPIDGETTRLVVRYRTGFAPGPLMGFVTWLFTDIGGAMLQQPAMLWGLRTRAERSYRAGSAGQR
jgi:protein-S-isoprenylcysteine O-methyltransferase Ste14